MANALLPASVVRHRKPRDTTCYLCGIKRAATGEYGILDFRNENGETLYVRILCETCNKEYTNE